MSVLDSIISRLPARRDGLGPHQFGVLARRAEGTEVDPATIAAWARAAWGVELDPATIVNGLQAAVTIRCGACGYWHLGLGQPEPVVLTLPVAAIFANWVPSTGETWEQCTDRFDQEQSARLMELHAAYRQTPETTPVVRLGSRGRVVSGDLEIVAASFASRPVRATIDGFTR